MTRRRWMADEASENRAAITGEHADHLVRVLRASVGQQFDIGTGTAVRRGRITSIEPARVEFELGEEISATAMPNITLLLAIFKFDRMEWAIEKCTELGVLRIVPAIARRTEKHLAAAAQKRGERWRKISRQAAEQSRRANPPEICAAQKLSEAVSLSGATRIVLAETESRMHLRDILNSVDRDLVLAIGPEGGWTDDELQLFQSTGWTSASLGPTILRAETAAIAATAIAISEMS